MGKDSSRRKSRTRPWLIFLMYLLLLMPLLGSETLAWKHSCVERTDHHSGEKTACPATPVGPSPSIILQQLVQGQRIKGSLGPAVHWGHQATGWLCLCTPSPRGLPLTQPDAHSHVWAVRVDLLRLWNGSRWVPGIQRRLNSPNGSIRLQTGHQSPAGWL